ncbi:MAG: WbqC family protein [Opitutaceae bacterium]|nr:WbqC family protein [Cytophagales bacterium]
MNTKRILILQSNYIPWKGYFDLINAVDEFVVYDLAQYTKNDWRNRNQIITPSGLKWLTIPVNYKYSEGKAIDEIDTSNSDWCNQHWDLLKHNYYHSPCFNEIETLLEPLYLNNIHTRLSDINLAFICQIMSYLNIETKILSSRNFLLPLGINEKLVSICKQRNATQYITGPSAKAYLNEELFAKEGIGVKFFDYNGYPAYAQSISPFENKVSILDLLFNTGKNAVNYMKTF